MNLIKLQTKSGIWTVDEEGFGRIDELARQSATYGDVFEHSLYDKYVGSVLNLYGDMRKLEGKIIFIERWTPEEAKTEMFVGKVAEPYMQLHPDGTIGIYLEGEPSNGGNEKIIYCLESPDIVCVADAVCCWYEDEVNISFNEIRYTGENRVMLRDDKSRTTISWGSAAPVLESTLYGVADVLCGLLYRKYFDPNRYSCEKIPERGRNRRLIEHYDRLGDGDGKLSRREFGAVVEDILNATDPLGDGELARDELNSLWFFSRKDCSLADDSE
jgi:hypothetical protein